MHDRVVPWGARPIVTVVVALHVGIPGEPAGVIVDAVTHTVRRVGTGFTASHDTVTMAPGGNLTRRGWNIEQQPVKEIDPRERGGYFAPFLVDIVATTGHIVIVADQRERLRHRRRITPGEMRITVPAQTDIRLRIGHGKSKLAGNRGTVAETVTPQ